MTLGIMQPYFFPYLGYYSLINCANYFILFDTPQYIRHGWVNRNRILSATENPTYITVPIQKTGQQTPINEIKIDNTQNWKKTIIGKLSFYKRISAPYYKDTICLVEDLLVHDYIKLSDLNAFTLKETCQYLGITTKIESFSSLNLTLDNINEPDDWALQITQQLKYDTYINPPGGMSFFVPTKYRNNGIELKFQEFIPTQYAQHISHFEPNLSILDCLMFCRPCEILDMLDNYRYLT